MMSKKTSPCIGICKFYRDGHCIGCSMTKSQKSISKRLREPRERDDFFATLMLQQNELGGYESWELKYKQKINAKT